MAHAHAAHQHHGALAHQVAQQLLLDDEIAQIGAAAHAHGLIVQEHRQRVAARHLVPREDEPGFRALRVVGGQVQEQRRAIRRLRCGADEECKKGGQDGPE